MSKVDTIVLKVFEGNTRQKILFMAYCLFLVVFFILRVIRNNQEFLFFSGVLASLYYFYNNEIFKFKYLKRVYFTLDSFLSTIFIVIGKETISMLFPLTTFILLFCGRFIFLKIKNREPNLDILLHKDSDRLYSLIIFACAVLCWIIVLIKYMDHDIV
ncbi:MAG: hypothetical protein IT238_00290 [Bacteroidia bacterium]|nr:hypothetical protein [Bacteroidia bacterium]